VLDKAVHLVTRIFLQLAAEPQVSAAVARDAPLPAEERVALRPAEEELV
jgi:hypothetical protein